MNGKLWFKNQIPVLLIHIFGIVALGCFLLVCNLETSAVLLIGFVWLAVLTLWLTVQYHLRKKELNTILTMAETLDERYLIAELLPHSDRAEDQVYHQILKLAEKSMLEKLEETQRERKEYKEYIEQWVHEVKTPITAIKLLCENNRSTLTRSILSELEKTDRFAEQALFYARSEHTEKDYLVRELRLLDVVHRAIVDNKYLLLQNQIAVDVEDSDLTIFSDEQWLQFILDQLIVNAVKYRSDTPKLHISAKQAGQKVELLVADNGIGIAESDLPRIFEKGFTGQNGRQRGNSTGIGLYLCKRLCEKLGIDLSVRSSHTETTVTLSFKLNDFVTEVRKG